MMAIIKKVFLASLLLVSMGISNSQTRVFEFMDDDSNSKNVRLEGVRQSDGTVIFQQSANEEDDDGVLFVKGEDGTIMDEDGVVVEEARSRIEPFYRAVVTQNTAQVRNLLEGGQNPNKVFDDGNTALHLAAGYKNEEMVSVLLANNASLTVRNKAKVTPMHNICAFGTQKMLAEAKSRLGGEYVKTLNLEGAYGRNCLHYAVLDSENTDLIKDLMSSGVNWEHISSEGQTPAHYAVMVGKWGNLKAMIQSNKEVIHVKAKNVLDEKTAEDLMMERMPILRLLDFLSFFNENNQDLLNDRFNRANL